MQKAKYSDWLQLVGLAGVIAGLFLVAFEVRQANRFAEAESIRSYYDAWGNIQNTSFDSDFFDTYIKSFEDPDNLTSTEIMKLDAWLASSMGLYSSQRAMQRMGLQPFDAAETLIENFDIFFGSQFARAWYLEGGSLLIDADLTAAIDREISIRPVQTSPKFVENIRSRIRTGKLSP